MPPLLVLDPSIQKVRKQAFKKAEKLIWRDCSGSSSSVGGFVFREPEEKKLVETGRLSDATTDADEVNMDV